MLTTLQHILDEAEKEFDEAYPESLLDGPTCLDRDRDHRPGLKSFLSSSIRHAVEAYAEAVRVVGYPKNYWERALEGNNSDAYENGWEDCLSAVKDKSRKFLGV